MVGSLKLLPGINSVSKEQWQAVATHPHVESKIESGDLEVVSMKEADQEGFDATQVHSLDEFKNQKALKIIEGTYDINLLKTWGAQEKRGQIKQACNDQIARIENHTVHSQGTDAHGGGATFTSEKQTGTKG